MKHQRNHLARYAAVAVLAAVLAVSAPALQAQDTLTVTSDGVAIGSVPPGNVDFLLTNVSGSGVTRFTLSNVSAGANWIYSNSGAGNFLVAKAGTGANEATFREANHGVATLSVTGHVQGTSFKSTSSRALKTAFEPIDSSSILASVVDLPVGAWRYKTEGEDVRHVGPFAEDFQSAFGLGDGNTIATVDADGILFAAVQALNSKLEARDAQIATLTERLAALEAQLVE